MSDGADKKHDASTRKLEKAREKGQIIRSADVTAAAGLAGMAMSMVAVGPSAIEEIGAILFEILARAGQFPTEALEPLLKGLLTAFGSLFIVPAVLVLVVLMIQRAIVFSTDKLQPKLARISILSNAQQKYGPKGLFEFLKSAAKLCVVTLVAVGVFVTFQDQILGTLWLEARPSLGFMTYALVWSLIAFAVAQIPIAVVDYLWQRHVFLKEQKMDDQEIKDEHKDSEGDPHMKQARRQRAREIAMGRMMQDVPDADVVIVNPVHVAVALKWSRAKGTAPVCVAKGHDNVALKIKEIAREAGVPIHQDIPAARAIDSMVEIGQEIPADLYAAVAAAIRFADEMRAKARASGLSL